SMRIEQWSATDTVATRGIYDAYQAMRTADDPAGPPLTWHRARMWLENPRMPTELWVTRDERTRAISAFCWLELPQRENRHRGDVLLVVHPKHRRRGIGNALLRHLAERAAANERTVLSTSLAQDSPGAAFARQAGGSAGLVEVKRVLHVNEESRARAAQLRVTAEKEAAGYTLVCWSGSAPDEFIDRAAGLHNAMNDAPREEGAEERQWDADRVRRELYDLLEAVGSRFHEVAAIHDATGEMAALTMVESDPEVPEWGHQQLTAVTRPHRGHRLGLLVKAAMLGRLAADEPGLRHIITGNADVNDHMIAINEQLGFESLRPWVQDLEIPVATVLE
ncbi:MAG: GNAT family N-acetyltransferase, partial [Trebonia sp.]